MQWVIGGYVLHHYECTHMRTSKHAIVLDAGTRRLASASTSGGAPIAELRMPPPGGHLAIAGWMSSLRVAIAAAHKDVDPWRWDQSRAFVSPEVTREAIRVAEAAVDALTEAIAARKIQRAWRRCAADPGYLACRNRLMREFEEAVVNGMLIAAAPHRASRYPIMVADLTD